MIAARNNPFRVSRIQAMGYLPQTVPMTQIRQRLEQLNYTAAIVGPHGSGKTTLLRELEKTRRQSGMQTELLFISQDITLPWKTIRSTIRSMPPHSVLFFDGACHLPFWRFRQLCRLVRQQDVGLLITAHREGRLPTLIRCRPRPELLTELTQWLLPENETIEQSHLAAVFQSHKGNLRDCLWQLYDEYAKRQD